MLTAIRVGNFKAFAESQLIPVRPLTLIYGANSSGKWQTPMNRQGGNEKEGEYDEQ